MIMNGRALSAASLLIALAVTGVQARASDSDDELPRSVDKVADTATLSPGARAATGGQASELGAAKAPARPLSPDFELLGRWDRGPTFSSTGLGDHAYFGAGGAIRILKIGEGASWQDVGSFSTGGVVKDLFASGHHIYVADRSGFLRIFDATNPAAPKEVGRLKLPERPQSVTVQDQYAYIACARSGILVIDVSDPTSPRLVGRFQAPGISRSMHVTGTLGVVAAGQLTLYDLSDPANPTELSRHPLPGSIIYAATVAGDHVYVTGIEGTSGLWIIDISDRRVPRETGFLPMKYGGEGIWVRDSPVYVAGVAGSAGLWVADVTDPTAPRWLGAWTHHMCTEGVNLIGSHAYVSHGDGGLEIIDISALPSDGAGFSKLPVVKHYDAAGRARGVNAVGNRVYLCNGYTGLRIIDASDPSALREVGHAPTYRALDVAIAGSHAFVADDNEGVRVIDVSDPSNPVTTARRRFGHDFVGVDISGGAAYFAASKLGLIVIDATKPGAIVELSRFDTPGTALDVCVRETLVDQEDGTTRVRRLVYVADGTAGLRIVDATDPVALREIDTHAPEREKWNVKAVDIVGNHAYLAGGSELLILDVSDPESISVLGRAGGLRGARAIAVSGVRAVVGDGTGVHLFDVSDSTAPVLLASRRTHGKVGGISVANGNVHVAAYEAGLYVFGSDANADGGGGEGNPEGVDESARSQGGTSGVPPSGLDGG